MRTGATRLWARWPPVASRPTDEQHLATGCFTTAWESWPASRSLDFARFTHPHRAEGRVLIKPKSSLIQKSTLPEEVKDMSLRVGTIQLCYISGQPGENAWESTSKALLPLSTAAIIRKIRSAPSHWSALASLLEYFQTLAATRLRA